MCLKNVQSHPVCRHTRIRVQNGFADTAADYVRQCVFRVVGEGSGFLCRMIITVRRTFPSLVLVGETYFWKSATALYVCLCRLFEGRHLLAGKEQYILQHPKRHLSPASGYIAHSP